MKEFKSHIMKQLVFVLTLFLSFSAFGQDTLTFSGFYYGNNVFVLNPFSSTGQGYCIKQVKVNGASIENISSSAFEIPLSNLEFYDTVKIEIFHENNTLPKILNPEVLLIDRTSLSFENHNYPYCVLKGRVLHKGSKVDSVISSKISVLNKSVLDSVYLGDFVPNSLTGSYICNLHYDRINELIFIAPNYQTKKVIIDLRSVPIEKRKSAVINSDIYLEPYKAIHSDSIFFNLPVAKLSFDHSIGDFIWDEHYEKAMEMALMYVQKSYTTGIEVASLENENLEISKDASRKRKIIYLIIFISLIIACLLFYSIYISFKRKKANTIKIFKGCSIE